MELSRSKVIRIQEKGGEPSGFKKQDVGGHLARKGIAYLGSVGFMWRKQSAFGNMEQERVLNPKGLIY